MMLNKEKGAEIANLLGQSVRMPFARTNHIRNDVKIMDNRLTGDFMIHSQSESLYFSTGPS